MGKIGEKKRGGKTTAVGSKAKSMNVKAKSSTTIPPSRSRCSARLIAKNKRASRSRPKFEDKEEEELWVEYKDDCKTFALEALNFYNQQSGLNYMLVKDDDAIDFLECAIYMPKTCFLHHLNFVAHNIDVPDAPLEVFFADLTSNKGIFTVHLCVSLGPIDSDSLPEVSNYGCIYCKPSPSGYIRHPKFSGWCKDYTVVDPQVP